jgi:hypothetical protein
VRLCSSSACLSSARRRRERLLRLLQNSARRPLGSELAGLAPLDAHWSGLVVWPRRSVFVSACGCQVDSSSELRPLLAAASLRLHNGPSCGASHSHPSHAYYTTTVLPPRLALTRDRRCWQATLLSVYTGSHTTSRHNGPHTSKN